MKTAKLSILALVAAVLSVSSAHAQEFAQAETAESKDDLSLDEQREKEIAKSDFIPNSAELEAEWTSLFAKPLTEQENAALEELASSCNRYANLVDVIYDQYQDYHGDNYRYEFVQEKVQPALSSYNELRNKFINCRNRAYYNLGEKYEIAGESVKAFFYYRDAFRLSGFSCYEGAGNCLRLKAEKNMAKILQIEDIQPYIHWE